MIPAPIDGRGLNPLLRNPGMIFHPPLLFLGFAGYAVPAAAAWPRPSRASKNPGSRSAATGTLLSWVFLTAGIVLGGWWSYMELGWGGYWAWDPVENASLIPWFAGTAVLHTAIIEARRNALQRTNVFLMSLTFILCVFSTYLTRSGVIDSLHTFGESAVGQPLFWGQVVMLAVTFMVVFLSERPHPPFPVRLPEPPGHAGHHGLVPARAGHGRVPGHHVAGHQPHLDRPGLGPGCQLLQPRLPAVPDRARDPVLLLSVARVEGRHPRPRGFFGVLGVFAAALAGFLAMGITKPLAALAASAAVGAMASIVLLFVLYPALRKARHNWGVYGIHLGLALMALGIAFSGRTRSSARWSCPRARPRPWAGIR